MLGQKIIIFFLCVLSWNTYALQWGGFLGFNYTEFESTVSWDHKLGLELGAVATHMITNNLFFRSGLGYVQKNSSTKAVSSGANIELTYLEIPVTILFKFADPVSLIGGINVHLKLSNECGGVSCGSIEPESYVANMMIGASFKTKDGKQIETLIEMDGLTDIARNITIGTSLSVRYVYMF